MVPQPLLQPVLQAIEQPLLQPVLQAVAQRRLLQQLVLQPVLQAVAQPVVQGAAATTVVQGAATTAVPQSLVPQLLTGVAQRAELRFARQVATRPLKTRPPTRLPLSQLEAVSQH